MASLERITESDLEGIDDISKLENKVSIENYAPLNDFLKSIKDANRREELKAEFEKVLSRYVSDIKQYSHPTRRALALEEAYAHLNNVPEGKDPQEFLRQQIYAKPGRNYPYVNAIASGKKYDNQIKYDVGDAMKRAVKEGLPVAGSGLGWWLTNNYMKELAKQPGVAESVTKAVSSELAKTSFWDFIKHPISTPGITTAKVTASAAGAAAKASAAEGATWLWDIVSKPLMYGIMAYGAYKTIKYFVTNKKEKKLLSNEVGQLEQIRRNMASQHQFVTRNLNPEFQTI